MTRPVTPARAHARIEGAFRLCAFVSRFGVRCVRSAQADSDYCRHHRGVQPRELVVLRDPRTGEPLEVA